ncbi:RidA family protein [Dialister pneumosintes]|jgi:endoribonuclease L-PSP, putative|uniref:Regulator n=1 Tax=Dialister pneumosintes TaxID=39950 RepID=A0A1B3WEG5_9FIRM|nr:RidA family protein [Dialister pneumosintes]AOH39352.1 regulator [Dialister pneumosintes]MBS6480213.1 RidA family protein [Dialister sp.]RID94751.1 RidA family protein [Dialister pneumosintes]CDF27413.1 putative endoribonuclease L-PSP [Dialister sp. CAG:588]
MKIIHSEQAPAAIGPYSQAYEANGFIFTSGQLGINPSTGKMPETITEQTEQACKNIAAILAASGLSMMNVIKTTCFLADINDFKAFNEVYAKHFVSKPARSCFAVKSLPANGLCEIEVIAAK